MKLYAAIKWFVVVAVAASSMGGARAEATGRRAAKGAGEAPSRYKEFLYRPAGDPTGVFQYGIRPNGALTPLNPPYVKTIDAPFDVIVPRNRRFAYVLCRSFILQYRIAKDGTLHPVDGPFAPVDASGYGGCLFSPHQRFAYVVVSKGIAQYSVSSRGALLPLSPRVALTRHDSCRLATMSPDGKFLYASNVDGTISQFRIRADGRLAPLVPAAVPAAPGPGVIYTHLLIFDPSGKYAYVPAYRKGSKTGLLSVFEREDDGTLRYVAGHDVPDGVLERHGSTLLLEWTTAGIESYRMDKHGKLKPIGNPAPQKPYGNYLAFTPDGRFAYNTTMGDFTDQIWQFRFLPDGSLAPLSPPTLHAPAHPVEGICVDPAGRFAYTISEHAVIGQYRIGSDGTLTAAGPPVVGEGTSFMITVVDPASPGKTLEGYPVR